MLEDNRKGCCPLNEANRKSSEGVVDHSMQTPGAGSTDPIPLKVISSGTTRLDQGKESHDSQSPGSGLITTPPIILRPGPRYWITPPELYNKLNNEFHFVEDVCPYPKSPDFDALNREWSSSNFCNPPFHILDGGPGLTPFVRKAISERDKGKTTAFLMPINHPIALMLKAGVEFRYVGRVPFIDTKTGTRNPKPSHIALCVLRGAGARAPVPDIRSTGHGKKSTPEVKKP